MGTIASLTVASLAAHAQSHWDAPDRAAKVSALIPGRTLAAITRETLFADWTRQQVEAWAKAHPTDLTDAELYQQYADAAPGDSELLTDFPRHIAPLARVRSGTPVIVHAAANALYAYCPLCQSESFSLNFDPHNAYHATTNCCHAELYGLPADYPAEYPLAATTTVDFPHLDDSTVSVPCTLYTDRDGVVWELYLKTLFDQHRWLNVGGDLVLKLTSQFKESGNPLYAHKLAILLDAVADTYYGLPLCYRNEIKEQTRAEWEASSRPHVFEVGPLGPWNRRVPNFNRGWLNMGGEHLWAEPFAVVRHHPAFKAVSIAKYGNADELDRKITHKLMRELALMLESVFAQKLLTNYQDAIYMNMILVGVLAEDKLLSDLYLPAHETTLYNHTYHDGLNGEGAPNYMAMPCGYFLPYLAKEDGWLRFQPDFLQANPFYATAIAQLDLLKTARGLPVEFGDQHISTWPVYGLPKDEIRADGDRRGSNNWADYGVGILRVGSPGRRLELCMDYTRATLHNGQDALSLETWVDGVPVMRHGGYACYWWSAPLQWERPEIQALVAMDFPHKIARADSRSPSWTWDYAHSALCHNSALVDGEGTGLGWGRDDRGYGEVVTYKGGEPSGQPGASFQVLDVRDDYAWPQSGKPEVTGFRRTLIAVETPSGHGYALDLLSLRGGREHALFNGAWAERADGTFPPVAATLSNLEDAMSGGGDQRGTDASYFRQIRDVASHEKSAATWEVTWKTDLAAYAPRQADGAFVRPMPEDDGKVRLRLIGLAHDPAGSELASARVPWVARLMQPLPDGQKSDGYLVFEGARDLIVERRQAPAEGELRSLFVHVIEGYREGEASAIASVEQLAVQSLEGDARDIVALRLTLVEGGADIVLYQSSPGIVRLPDGTETDARYLLLRTAPDGSRHVESARASFVRGAGHDADLGGDLTGTIVDIIGDISGTRQESALILATDQPWPEGTALAGRQILITFESELRRPGAEGYRIASVTPLAEGRIRLDLQDHAPFIESWHDVYDFPSSSVIRTTRPMGKHSNNPWYDGLVAWFPEKGRTYTIASTHPVNGGRGGETITFQGEPDVAADGIAPGDWFVIYGIRPGLKVNVAGEGRVDTATTP